MSVAAIRELLADAADAGEDCLLCTVARLDGSGYGRPGARLVLCRDGRRAGFVSGGCLERELARLAWPATETGPATLTFDTRGEPTRLGGRYNAGCEGCVHILCERVRPGGGVLPPTAGDDPWKSAVAYASTDPSVAVGSRSGAAVAEALHGPDRTHTRIVITDGGEVGVLVEWVEPPQPLVIFGAGDDAVPLATMAAAAGRRVTVVSPQAELLTATRFPLADRLHTSAAEAAGRLRLTPRTACVLMTHSFADDAALLPKLLPSPTGYVGVLGPKRRIGRLMTELHSRGELPAEDNLAKLRSPVGLDIGARTPEEIAVAVLAELIAFAHDRDGRPLRERAGPIHEPQEHLGPVPKREWPGESSARPRPVVA